MDCRDTRALLTAFHDGELPVADRARVEEHLRGCPECSALRADLARADAAAGVPDPGPAYWDRFNARVTERIEREAKSETVAVLRPKRGWMRHQLRYLVPAVAAAALVVVVVRYGGRHPAAPTPAVPPAVGGSSQLDSEAQRMANAKIEFPGAKKAESRRVTKAPVYPAPAIADERFAAVNTGERGEMAERSLSEEKESMSRDRAAAAAGIGAAAPAGIGATAPAAPAAEPQLAAKAETPPDVRIAKDRFAAEATREISTGKERAKAGQSPSASALTRPAAPCELARTLADRGRLKEAEDAQRRCLAEDRSAPAQEKGLIFLAELLDRQARFAEADLVLGDAERQFPHSRPLDFYRRQRPTVQTEPTGIPATR